MDNAIAPEGAKILLASLGAAGGMSFSWPMILGGFIFGTVGFFAFMHGWKTKSWRPLAIGAALSIFPWFVTNVFVFYLVGGGLCWLLYYFRD